MEFKWRESTQSDPWRIASCCYTDGYVYKYHGSHQQIKSHRAEKPLPIKWYIDLHETAVAWVNEPGKIIPLLSQSDCSQREERRKTHILFPSWFGGKKSKPLYTLSSFCPVFSIRLFLTFCIGQSGSISSAFCCNLFQIYHLLMISYLKRKPSVRTVRANLPLQFSSDKAVPSAVAENALAGLCTFSSTGTNG